MSRKDNVAMAEIIKSSLDEFGSGSLGSNMAVRVLEDVARETAAFFKRDNSRFDRDRYYRACGFPELAAN